TRFKRQFLVNVNVPTGVDNAMLLSYSEKKLVDMLLTIFSAVDSGSGSSIATA
ncbi:hypothetical protein BGZ94_005323, partial [Podila epigama]